MGYGLWAVGCGFNTGLLQSTVQAGKHTLDPMSLSRQTLVRSCGQETDIVREKKMVLELCG